jgi:hypothetical protein
MSLSLSVTDILDEHVTLEIEGIDRLYLNGYVPSLQWVGGVVGFFRRHRRGGGDCDDTRAFVFQELPDLFRDCNADAIADDPVPQTVCVGEARQFYWEDEEGLHVSIHYPDADAIFWIPRTVARKKDGMLIVAAPNCGVR